MQNSIEKSSYEVNFVVKCGVESGTKEEEGVNQNLLPTGECLKLDLEVIGMD